MERSFQAALCVTSQQPLPSLSQDELSVEEEFMNPDWDWHGEEKENGRKQERKIIKMKNEQDL